MREKLVTGGAVAAAAAASLCCVGPLVFVLLGLGSFGAVAALGTARSYLMGAAALLLAFGFYRAYIRREAGCAPGEACATKPVGRASRASLWVAAAAVIAFALSPYYAGALAERVAPAQTETAAAFQAPAAASARFKVSGMTCAGCETTIKLALEKTPGVRSSEVSYDRGEAVVEYDPGRTTPEKLRDAISATGYPAEAAK